ncbi:hypothetical protein [Vibrio phage vB_VhaP_PG11]|nr:hypothetical protein [Vibrio phage vB_VhaP_PG11]
MSRLNRFIQLRKIDIAFHEDDVCMALEKIPLVTSKERRIIDTFKDRLCAKSGYCEGCLLENRTETEETIECLE